VTVDEHARDAGSGGRLRGRSPGEMTRLITAALEQGRPGMTIVPAAGPSEALRSALAMTSGPADPVLFLYEKLEPALALLGTLGATPQPG
jgi:hypothetical protein